MDGITVPQSTKLQGQIATTGSGSGTGHQDNASLWVNDAAHQYNVTVPSNLIGVTQIDAKAK